MTNYYTFLAHKAAEPDTGYLAECLELPGCVAQGETLEELKRNTREALVVKGFRDDFYPILDDF